MLFSCVCLSDTDSVPLIFPVLYMVIGRAGFAHVTSKWQLLAQSFVSATPCSRRVSLNARVAGELLCSIRSASEVDRRAIDVPLCQ